MPEKIAYAKATVIDGMVYVGGGYNIANDDVYHVYKYDPVKNEWSTLPPTPVVVYGVGELNGKLVIVGGVESNKVHVFDEDTQQWVESILPMPNVLIDSKVITHNSTLIECGMSGNSSLPSMFIYCHQSSQWHSRAPPPVTFNTVFSSAVILNETYYIAVGAEGIMTDDPLPSSSAVFSQSLSTLLDPNIPSTW